MWDGFDKRKFPRVKLRCEITIQPPAPPGPINSFTQNVGAGGVCVILDASLKRFAVCRVRLEVGKDLPTIECDSRVVWSVPIGQAKSKKTQYDTGLEFLGMDPEITQVLRDYLENLIPSE